LVVAVAVLDTLAVAVLLVQVVLVLLSSDTQIQEQLLSVQDLLAQQQLMVQIK
jgi:hypothetical protein